MALTEFASTVCAKEADGAADVGEALPGREVKIVAGGILLRASSVWPQATGGMVNCCH